MSGDANARSRVKKDKLSRLLSAAAERPVLAKLIEYSSKFLLSLTLTQAALYGGQAPLALALTAAGGVNGGGAAILIGAVAGYSLLTMTAMGFRYAASCLLVFAAGYIFRDFRLTSKPFFMPAAAAGITCIVGIGFIDGSSVFTGILTLAAESAAAGLAALFFAMLLRPSREIRAAARRKGRTAGAAVMFIGILIALCRVEAAGFFNFGRALGAFAVLAAGCEMGIGAGAAVGACIGLSADLACGGGLLFAVVFAVSGMAAGGMRAAGKPACAAVFFAACSAALLWAGGAMVRLAGMCEAIAAVVIFIFLPRGYISRAAEFFDITPHPGPHSSAEVRTEVRRRLESAAGAFREVAGGISCGLIRRPPNDADIATVFDRASARICRGCVLSRLCWDRDALATYNSLSSASGLMLKKGDISPEDFPSCFSERCIHFPEFVAASREELRSLMWRRQYRSEVERSRKMLCSQYAELSGILSSVAGELADDISFQPDTERKLERMLRALGLSSEAAVCREKSGRLNISLSCPVLSPEDGQWLGEKISRITGEKVRMTSSREGQLSFLSCDRYGADIAAALRRKDGNTVCGDRAEWFPLPGGGMAVMLSDGMGSGEEAARESTETLGLLKRFLMAGICPESALDCLKNALDLRDDGSCAYATVDLLVLDLMRGQADFYKLGAAASFVIKKDRVHRVSAASLPAAAGEKPEHTALSFSGGEIIILASDGLTEGIGGQIEQTARNLERGGSREIADALIAKASYSGAADDMAAVAISIYKE